MKSRLQSEANLAIDFPGAGADKSCAPTMHMAAAAFPKSMPNESVGGLQPVMQTLPLPPPAPPLLLLLHNRFCFLFSEPSGLESGQLRTQQDQEPRREKSGGHKQCEERRARGRSLIITGCCSRTHNNLMSQLGFVSGWKRRTDAACCVVSCSCHRC